MRRLGSFFAASAVVGAVMAPLAAFAGGFEIPDNGARNLSRGTAFSVLADDLSAMILNPGAMTRSSGTRFYLSYNLVHAPLSFDRQESQLAEDGERPPPRSNNETPIFPLGLSAVVSSNFGLEDWVFFAGVYGPNAAGSASYEPDSAARYMLTDLELVLIYYSAGVAWGKEDHFGIGATLQLAHAPKGRFELVVDGSKPGSPLSPYTSTFDVLAKFDLADAPHVTAIIGGWWRIIPELEIGLSGRIAPVYLKLEGDLSLEGVGELFQNGGTLHQTGTAASITAVVPPTVRGGLRYRHLDAAKEFEVFDIELDVVYEAWSMLEAYEVNIDTAVSVTQEVPGGTQIMIVPETKVPPLKVDKQWKDTISVRLGGTWNILPDHFAFSAGGFWESGAQADEFAYVDFSAYERFGVGGGFRFQFAGVDLNLSYLHIFQADVVADESTAKGFQQRPLGPCPADCPAGPLDPNTSQPLPLSGVPANAGRYKSSFDQLGISLGFHFDEWMD